MSVDVLKAIADDLGIVPLPHEAEPIALDENAAIQPSVPDPGGVH